MLTTHKAETGQKLRRSDTRAKLLQAARTLFVARGYYATRPQDISRAAGVGHGTFYLHFPDKRACFLAFVEEARAELDAVVAARAAGARDIGELIARSLEAIFDYSESRPGVLVTAMSDDAVIAAGAAPEHSLVTVWAQAWATQFRERLGARFPAGLDPRVAGAGVVGFIHQAGMMGGRLGLPRPEIIRMLTDFIVRALDAAGTDAKEQP